MAVTTSSACVQAKEAGQPAPDRSAGACFVF
jgi:hypothetical protein